MKSMDSFLVTGGLGFIGSYFTKALVEKGLQTDGGKVVVLDAMTYAADEKRLEGVDYILIQGDIQDEALVQHILERFHITHIAHFAAESHVDRSLLTPRLFYDTNVAGTLSLLQGAKNAWAKTKTGFQDKLFLHISTDEVYGSILPEERAAEENFPLNPGNPYAASKAAAEQFVIAYAHSFQLPTLITRSANNYGLYQHEEKFIPKVLKALWEEKSIPLYGQGRQMRNWIHVKDHVDILLALIEKGAFQQVYNIKGEETFSNLELIYHLAKCLEERGIVREPQISFVPDRPGHDFYYHISDEKLKKTGHKKIQYSLKNLVSSYVNAR